MLAVLPSIEHSHKVNVVHRVAAKLVDLFLVIFVALLLPYPLGPLLGFAYSLVADGIPHDKWKGQSIGKKLFGLQVINQVRQEPADLRDSIMRNAPVGVVTFFAIIPLWGWVILTLIGIPLMALEIYLMVKVDTGHRLGDVMGQTDVVSIRSRQQ